MTSSREYFWFYRKFCIWLILSLIEDHKLYNKSYIWTCYSSIFSNECKRVIITHLLSKHLVCLTKSNRSRNTFNTMYKNFAAILPNLAHPLYSIVKYSLDTLSLTIFQVVCLIVKLIYKFAFAIISGTILNMSNPVIFHNSGVVSYSLTA